MRHWCIVSADEVARLRDVIWSEAVGPWIEDVGLPNGLRVLRPPGACVQLPRSFAVPAAFERVYPWRMYAHCVNTRTPCSNCS